MVSVHFGVRFLASLQTSSARHAWLTPKQDHGTRAYQVSVIDRVAGGSLLRVRARAGRSIFRVYLRFVGEELFVQVHPIIVRATTTCPRTRAVVFQRFNWYFAFLLVISVMVVTVSRFRRTSVTVFTFHVVFGAFRTSRRRHLTRTVRVYARQVRRRRAIEGQMDKGVIVMNQTYRQIVRSLIRATATGLFKGRILRFVATIDQDLVTRVELCVIARFRVVVSMGARGVLSRISVTLCVGAVCERVGRRAFNDFKGSLRFRTFRGTLSHFGQGRLTSRYVSLVMDRFRAVKNGQGQVGVLSDAHGHSTYRFLGRRDNALRRFSHLVQVRTTFVTREDVHVRARTANYLASPDQVRDNQFRRCVLDLFHRAKVRSTGCANSARQLFRVTGRRVAINRHAFRAVRHRGLNAFHHQTCRSFVAFSLVNVREIRELSCTIRSVIHGVRRIVGKARTSRLRAILRPFQAFLCDCVFGHGA